MPCIAFFPGWGGPNGRSGMNGANSGGADDSGRKQNGSSDKAGQPDPQGPPQPQFPMGFQQQVCNPPCYHCAIRCTALHCCAHSCVRYSERCRDSVLVCVQQPMGQQMWAQNMNPMASMSPWMPHGYPMPMGDPQQRGQQQGSQQQQRQQQPMQPQQQPGSAHGSAHGAGQRGKDGGSDAPMTPMPGMMANTW